MADSSGSVVERFRGGLENAVGYGDLWKLVKDCVWFALHKRRSSIMLFLDDLPIQIGAYYPVGTNNIVLNRVFVQIVEATTESRRVINALIYNLLVHEYLHALGEYSESAVRQVVVEVAKKCFGIDHTVTAIAKKTPWALLKGIPLGALNPPKRVMEIVKGFEKTDGYIV